MRILWCITGGEHLLAECVGLIEGLGDVTVVFSAAGQEVAGMYGFLDRIKAAAREVVAEGGQGRCAPIIMSLRSYEKVVVAPCTANTAAKVAHGIADSIVSNIVSQALKVRVEVVVLPTDSSKEITGKTVGGGDIRIRCRDVDIRNVRKLKDEMKVVYTPEELAGALKHR
jgi:flavoprotein